MRANHASSWVSAFLISLGATARSRLRSATAALTIAFHPLGGTLSIGRKRLFFIVPYLVLIWITSAHNCAAFAAPAGADAARFIPAAGEATRTAATRAASTAPS